MGIRQRLTDLANRGLRPPGMALVPSTTRRHWDEIFAVRIAEAEATGRDPNDVRRRRRPPRRHRAPEATTAPRAVSFVPPPRPVAWSRMPRRATWPIVLAGAIPVLVAVPGAVLGVLQLWDAWRHPPETGILSLGTILGFWLVLGSLFVICAALLLAGLARDVREIRNRRLSSPE